MEKSRLTFRVLIGVLVLWVVAFVLWRMIQSPREARARLESIRYVLAVVAQYAREHQGAWPKSWEEIEKINPPQGAPPRKLTWPEIRNYVKVDFKVDPRALVKAGPDQFSAIEPKGSCGDYREDVAVLLRAIEEGLNSAASAPQASSGVLEPGAKISPSSEKASSPTDSSSAEPPKPSPQEKAPSEKTKSEQIPSEAPKSEKTPSEKPVSVSPEQEKPKEKKTSPRIVLPGLE